MIEHTVSMRDLFRLIYYYTCFSVCYPHIIMVHLLTGQTVVEATL